MRKNKNRLITSLNLILPKTGSTDKLIVRLIQFEITERTIKTSGEDAIKIHTIH